MDGCGTSQYLLPSCIWYATTLKEIAARSLPPTMETILARFFCQSQRVILGAPLPSEHLTRSSNGSESKWVCLHSPLTRCVTSVVRSSNDLESAWMISP